MLKKITGIIVCISLLFIYKDEAKAQSMYGDAVKADIKMNYVYSFEEALKLSKEQNKLIFFNCFADWAAPCHAMNKTVFSDQKFADWMDKNFICYFTDVKKGNGKVLAKKYNVVTMAHYLVLDSDGEVVHRIVGGGKIDDFKQQLTYALKPTTSLRGMNEQYDAGNINIKFLRAYLPILRRAEEDIRAKEVQDLLFSKIAKKDWVKKENWYVFSKEANNIDNEYAKYLLDNRGSFEKHNGTEKVTSFISGLMNKKVFSYAVGNITYNEEEMLDIFLTIQKADLPNDDTVHSLYSFAKNRGEHKIEELINILNTNKNLWGPNLLRTIDLSLSRINDYSKDERKILTEYWQSRADSYEGTGGNHYKRAIVELNTISGIKFSDLSFKEAVDKASKENKLVFMDCYTTWCAPCKWLDSNTFKDEKVGEYFNERFVNIKIDMEKGDGPNLVHRYDIKAFPTLLLLDSNGVIVKRMTGALKADKLLEKIQED